MTISLHETSVAALARALRNMAAILDKASVWATEKQKTTPPTLSIEQGLLGTRLAPDMFPFSRQIQIATDMAKGCGARLASIEPPKYEDTEASFDDLKVRLEKTASFLDSVDQTAVDASADRQINLKAGTRELSFSGRNYVNVFVLPNVYFHLSMAYAVLRQAGVPIGKNDFLGG